MNRLWELLMEHRMIPIGGLHCSSALQTPHSMMMMMLHASPPLREH
jgi:hypothetical protein